MITAVILSAGVSSRMGEPKALLKYGEKTFIRNIIDNIKSAGVNELFVVLGFHKEKIEPFIKDAKIVINPNPESGQFSSLKIGIQNIPPETNAVLVQLVDVPAVMPETYNAVIMAHKNNPEKIIMPYYDTIHSSPRTQEAKDCLKGLTSHTLHFDKLSTSCATSDPTGAGQPFASWVHGHPIIFPRKFFKALLNYPVSKSARDFIHEQTHNDIINLEVNDMGILKDFDTKEDLKLGSSDPWS